LTRKAESSGCYVVVIVVDGGRRAMGPGKQVIKEVHEGPAEYKRRTRKGATVEASQWEVVREESWKLERGRTNEGCTVV
jgi:hypothetical protein